VHALDAEPLISQLHALTSSGEIVVRGHILPGQGDLIHFSAMNHTPRHNPDSLHDPRRRDYRRDPHQNPPRGPTCSPVSKTHRAPSPPMSTAKPVKRLIPSYLEDLEQAEQYPHKRSALITKRLDQPCSKMAKPFHNTDSPNAQLNPTAPDPSPAVAVLVEKMLMEQNNLRIQCETYQLQSNWHDHVMISLRATQGSCTAQRECRKYLKG